MSCSPPGRRQNPCACVGRLAFVGCGQFTGIRLLMGLFCQLELCLEKRHAILFDCPQSSQVGADRSVAAVALSYFNYHRIKILLLPIDGLYLSGNVRRIVGER